MKWLKMSVVAGVFSLGLPFLVAPSSASAIDFIGDSCEGNSSDGICSSNTKGKTSAEVRADAASNIANIIDALLYLIGAIAIIMIVAGGFRFVTSRGDQNAVQQAKNMILYAVIGIVLALLAKVIVTFVVGML